MLRWPHRRTAQTQWTPVDAATLLSQGATKFQRPGVTDEAQRRATGLAITAGAVLASAMIAGRSAPTDANPKAKAAYKGPPKAKARGPAADAVMSAIDREVFLILPHPEVAQDLGASDDQSHDLLAGEQPHRLGERRFAEVCWHLEVIDEGVRTDVKAKGLSGTNNLLFRRNSLTGVVEVSSRTGAGIVLNSALH
mgnify:CR=1 FL=1